MLPGRITKTDRSPARTYSNGPRNQTVPGPAVISEDQ